MMLDPDARTVLDMMAASGRPSMDMLSPDEARRAMRDARAALTPDSPEVQSVRAIVATGPSGPLQMRAYHPIGGASTDLPAILYFHGGGWVVGDLESHDAVCRRLCCAAGAAVVAIDYRLAPEHCFPAAAQDALAAIRWVHANAGELGLDPTRLAAAGDSAGGNLAAVAALLARDGGGLPLRGLLLAYPVTDLATEHHSYGRYRDGYFLTASLMRWFRNHYLAAPDDATDWRASPLLAADLSGLPPTTLIQAGHDPLFDEGVAFADRLEAAGCLVERHCYSGQIHGFLTMGRVIGAAGSAIDTAAAALARYLG